MAVESEAVAQAVIALLQATDEWSGNAKDLLVRLATLVPAETTKSRDWPRTPKGLGGKLRSATPMLRSAGIEVLPPRDGDTKTRTWVLRRVPKTPDPGARQTRETTAPTAPTATDGGFSSDFNDLDGSDWGAVGEPSVAITAPTATNRYPTATQPLPEKILKTQWDSVNGSDGSDGSGPSARLSGRPPRAISDSPENRQWVPETPTDMVSTTVWVSEIPLVPVHRRPALGPVGDSLDDLRA
jgi:hypothetical protein